MDYQDCSQVMALLEDQTKGEGQSVKNFFGQYASGNLRTWSKILSAYKSSNLYLAEAARNLSSATKYEIPNLKKVDKACGKESSDIIRKISESQRNAKLLQGKYEKLCKKLSVVPDSEDMRGQILASGKELAKELNLVHAAAAHPLLAQAIEFYQAYSAFLLQQNEMKEIAVVSTLARIVSAGVTETEMEEEEEEGADAGEAVEIDWGIEVDEEGQGEENQAIEINWEMPEADLEVVEAPAAAAAGLPADEEVAEIDWGIVSQDGGEIKIDWTSSVTEAEAELEPMLQAVSENSLMDSSTRQQYMTDLYELEAFLIARVRLGSTADDMTLFKNSPALRNQSEFVWTQYLEVTRKVIQALSSPRLQELVMIATSRSYVDRLVNSIHLAKASVQRVDRYIDTYNERRAEISDTVNRTRLKLKAVVKKSRTLKTWIQETLSEQLKVQVTVMADIPNQL